MTRKPPLVIITWVDARDLPSASVEYNADKIKEIAQLITRETSGFLVYEDTERTVLAHDYDAEEDPVEVGNFTIIPTGWVKSIKHVRGKRKPKEAKSGD